METLKDYWLETRNTYMSGLLAESRNHVLLNIKSTIDLAPNKDTLYIKPQTRIRSISSPNTYTRKLARRILTTPMTSFYRHVFAI
nr:MAG TPA: hypothetical protein [Caudoviricetes sp.]